MNNTERLIGKMNDELAAFVAGLERLPVQDVIEKAGEIAVKTDMALLVEEAFLGPKETKALLGMWEEAVCYLTGAEMQFGDYGKIKAYFIGNTNYAADQF